MEMRTRASGNGQSHDGRADQNGHGPAVRLPPQNLEAEQCVLGSMLLDPNTIDDVQPLLPPDRFYAAPNFMIAEALYHLNEKGAKVDPVTLGHELARRKNLDEVGGTQYLIQIIECVPHASHAQYYAKIVNECWTRRRVIDACADTMRDAYNAGMETGELIARHDNATQRMLETQFRATDVYSMGTLLEQLFVENEHEKLPTLKTGIDGIDNISGGLRGGNLIVLAARASMGKTAMALELIRRMAAAGTPCLMFSLEMTALEVGERMISAESGVSAFYIRKGNLSVDDHGLLAEAANRLHTLPIHVDDRSDMTPSHIAAVSRRMRRSHNIGLIAIDYLQFVRPDTPSKSREQDVSEISRRMKSLAKSIGVPVVLLSQLNREVAKRENNIPKLHDLRESGAIEQDADQVWFLHRPEYYDPTDHPGMAEIIIAKNRNGPITGPNRRILMRFENGPMRFSEMVGDMQGTLDWDGNAVDYRTTPEGDRPW